LAGNSIYVCTEHNRKVLERYFNILDAVFYKIKDSIDKKADKELLNGPVCIGGLRNKNS
jgi:glutamate-1-semialdehyde 2,1-aminomutase